MLNLRVFISGAMVSHELDVDRESARHAINALAPDFTAFAYELFPKTWTPIPEDKAQEDARSEIARSEAFILLVGKTVSSLCLKEFTFARRLGMPCRVFLKAGGERKTKLRRFLANCPCDVITYSNPVTELVEHVQEFCRSLLSAKEEKQEVVLHTVNVWRSLIQELARDPERVFGLSPRKFEELLAEIIASLGYTTTLTPSTRDGGYDILAKRKDPLFPSFYLVEAKLWTPPRAVGSPVIRGIYGAGMAENCNGVMVVTPSIFSRDALNFLDEKKLKEFVRLVDGTELPNLYTQYLISSQ